MLCELRNTELHVLYVSSNVNLGKQIKGEENRQICSTQREEQQFIKELVSKPKKTSDTSSLTARQHLNAPRRHKIEGCEMDSSDSG